MKNEVSSYIDNYQRFRLTLLIDRTTSFTTHCGIHIYVTHHVDSCPMLTVSNLLAPC